MTQTAKKAYVKPAVKSHGAIETLTQGGKNGDLLDMTFPVGTPRGSLTFS